MIRYGSVCSGIEAASVAWEPLGWEPAFFSDIEAFPRAVLKHRFPHVPLHGDFTTIGADDYGPVQLLVGGTPCQDYSIAGLRAGLDGARGNLTLAFAHLAYAKRPRWLLWENVPGVFSTNDGRDFGAILATFSGRHGSVFEPPADGWGNSGFVEPADADSYGLAWRVLDAQYTRVDGHSRAVPQRRRRVFIVGHLGDMRPAAAVLFDAQSLRRDHPPRREPGQRASRTADAGFEVCGALSDGAHMGGGSTDRTPTPGAFCQSVANPLTARMHKGINTTLDEGQTPIITTGGGFDVAHTLRAEGFDSSEELAPTIRQGGDGGGNQPAVAFQPRIARNGRGYSEDVALALNGADAGATSDMRPCVASPFAVRRLTPRECERLQGFPDGWTEIPWRGKPADQCPDGPRYKVLGNSMAVNVMRRIGRRIEYVEQILSEMEAWNAG